MIDLDHDGESRAQEEKIVCPCRSSNNSTAGIPLPRIFFRGTKNIGKAVGEKEERGIVVPFPNGARSCRECSAVLSVFLEKALISRRSLILQNLLTFSQLYERQRQTRSTREHQTLLVGPTPRLASA